MKKEDIIMNLRSLGFDPQESEGGAYLFRYEGFSVLYMPDDDEDFLRLAIPCIFDVTEENSKMVLELVNRTNMRMKYTKTCVFGEAVWTFYEARIWNDSDVETMLEHSMSLLAFTVYLFRKMVEGDDDDMDE